MEFSIVSSLSWDSILVQHACNVRAWLTSECSERYDNEQLFKPFFEGKCKVLIIVILHVKHKKIVFIAVLTWFLLLGKIQEGTIFGEVTGLQQLHAWFIFSYNSSWNSGQLAKVNLITLSNLIRRSSFCFPIHPRLKVSLKPNVFSCSFETFIQVN